MAVTRFETTVVISRSIKNNVCLRPNLNLMGKTLQKQTTSFNWLINSRGFGFSISENSLFSNN
jgi:hypothetical protein